MTLVEFEGFPSHPTSDRCGRIYAVTPEVQLVAYELNLDSLAELQIPLGLIVYAFVKGDRVGYWNSTTDPQDLEWVMETYRSAFTGRPMRTGVRAPRIRPTYNRDLAQQLRAVDADRHLDVSTAFGEPEQQADVIPLHRKR